MRYLRSVIVLLIILAGHLVGCSSILLKKPAVYILGGYRLTPLSTAGRASSVLYVTTPRAAPALSTSKMLYMIQPYRIESYAYHRWVAPPAQMLLPLLVQAVQRRRYFHAVIAAPFSGHVDDQLVTQLLLFRMELFRPTAMVHIAIQASVIRSVGSQVLASKVFDVRVPCRAVSPYEGVLAADRAVQRITRKIAAFATRAVQKKTT